MPLALVLVGAAAWYHFAFAGFTLRGEVLDSATGQPVADARVWSARASATGNPDGVFMLDRVRPPDAIGVDAPGYHPGSLRVLNPFRMLSPRLEPVSVEVDAVDADTNTPIPSAALDGAASVVSLGDGRLRVAPVRDGQKLSLSASGYLPTETSFAGQTVLTVALRPRLDGHVVDASTGRAVAGARVALPDGVLTTDADGAFQLPHRSTSGTLQLLAPGYRRADVDLSQPARLEVQLQPNPVHATYLTYFAVAGDDYRQDLVRMLDSTEVNAVVLDIKGDYGLLSYPSGVPLAEQIGANSATGRGRAWTSASRIAVPADCGSTARTWRGLIRINRPRGITTPRWPARPSSAASTKSSSTTSASRPIPRLTAASTTSSIRSR